MVTGDLGPIHGIETRELAVHSDHRSDLAVLHQASWRADVALQWNLATSHENVLRGAHVHIEHIDWLLVLNGVVRVGLMDIRPDLPSCGTSAVFDLEGRPGHPSTVLSIPPGVVHGFFSPVASTHLYATSTEWDPADEFGCRWDDPALAIPWGCADPVLSARDRDAGTLAALCELLARHTGG